MTKLSYATKPTYLRRRSGRMQALILIGWIVLFVAITVLLFLGLKDERRFPLWQWATVLLISGVIAMVYTIRVIRRNGFYECRIEGGKVYYQDAMDGVPQVVDIGDVVELALCDSGETYELRTKDRRTFTLRRYIIGSMGRFRNALIAENPRIREASYD